MKRFLVHQDINISSILVHTELPCSLCVCAHMCVLSCVWLCKPMDWSTPGSSVHGISQARILECVAISCSRGSFQPRDRTLKSPALAGGFSATTPPGKRFVVFVAQLFSHVHPLRPPGLQHARLPWVCSNTCCIESAMRSNHLILCCPLLLNGYIIIFQCKGESYCVYPTP